MQLLLFSLLALFVIEIAVLVHEYGHLRTAQKHGIRVEEFSIGFGKKIKTWTTKKGLEVNLKLIPAGGSVSPAGMTVEEVREKNIPKNESYIYATPWTRFRVTFAGIGYNILLAVLIEIIVVPMLIQPSTWQEWIGLPGTVFWATLAILGAFLGMLLSAPINGFENVNSIIRLPSGLEETVTSAESQEISTLAVILMSIMALNMFMAIFNCLPIYPLDGFFLVTAVVDWSRKSIHEEKYEPLAHERMKWWVIAGYTLTFSLWTFLIFRDIIHLI